MIHRYSSGYGPQGVIVNDRFCFFLVASGTFLESAFFQREIKVFYII